MISRRKPTPLNLTATKKANNEEVIPSPTYSTSSLISSMSWIADKAPQELIPMLKNAYFSLKEKEKDLILAAEIGKQLLTTNVQLEQNYQQLLQSVQQQEQQHTIQDKQDIYYNSGDDDDDDDDGDNNNTNDEHDECPSMQYVSSMNARQVIIEVLEQKNIELNGRLESLTEEYTTIQHKNGKRTKELETEMTALKNDLEMATNKIRELELMNQRQKKRLSRDDGTAHKDSDGNVISSLLDDVQRLQAEQQQAQDAKQALEAQLAAALKDLNQLKVQLDTFEFTEQGYKSLQQTYDHQFQHINQLNQSLEDHRSIFQKLRDRGINIHSLSSTPSPSVIMTDEKDDDNIIRHTLLHELESEWNKKQQQSKQSVSASVSASLPSSTSTRVSASPAPPSTSSSASAATSSSSSYSFHKQPLLDLDPFEKIISKATGIDPRLVDDALSLIYRLEQEIEQPTPTKLRPQFLGEDERLSFDTSVINDDDQQQLIHCNNGIDDVSGEGDHDNSYLALVDYTFPSQGLYPNLNLIQPYAGTMTKYDPSTTRHGIIRQWISKAFRRIWRWFRFAFVLSTAVMLSLWSGPDSMLLTLDSRQ